MLSPVDELLPIGDFSRQSGLSSLATVNVGDNHAYLIHECDLTQLTRDHTVTAPLVERGEITESEALDHPHPNVLTRVLGGGPNVGADALPTQRTRVTEFSCAARWPVQRGEHRRDFCGARINAGSADCSGCSHRGRARRERMTTCPRSWPKSAGNRPGLESALCDSRPPGGVINSVAQGSPRAIAWRDADDCHRTRHNREATSEDRNHRRLP